MLIKRVEEKCDLLCLLLLLLYTYTELFISMDKRDITFQRVWIMDTCCYQIFKFQMHVYINFLCDQAQQLYTYSGRMQVPKGIYSSLFLHYKVVNSFFL